MLSQSSEYALRAVLRLSLAGEGESMRTKEIASDLDIPRNYLSKILHELVGRGILTSTRGPHGGFRLARPAAKIMLAEVVRVFDPDLFREDSRCILGKKICSDRDPCLAHTRWQEVSATLRGFFTRTTLAELRSSAPVGPSD